MVIKDNVHVMSASLKAPAFGGRPSQTNTPVATRSSPQEHKYSKHKLVAPSSATGSAVFQNTSSRVVQILNDGKSRKNEQRAIGPTNTMSKMRLGLRESVLGSKNDLVNLRRSTNGTTHNMDPRNPTSNCSHASVASTSGRPLANRANMSSKENAHQSAVTYGLLHASNTISSPRDNKHATPQVGVQWSSRSPVATGSNQIKGRHEQVGSRRPMSDARGKEASSPPKTKQKSAVARSMSMLRKSGNERPSTAIPKEQSRTTNNGTSAASARWSSVLTMTSGQAGAGGPRASNGPRQNHLFSRGASDPTTKPAPSRPVSSCRGNKAAAVGVNGKRPQPQANSGREVAGGKARKGWSTLLGPKDKASKVGGGGVGGGDGGALAQYLKKEQMRKQKQEVEEPPLFMVGNRMMMDWESIPNSFEDDRAILDLPDP